MLDGEEPEGENGEQEENEFGIVRWTEQKRWFSTDEIVNGQIGFVATIDTALWGILGTKQADHRNFNFQDVRYTIIRTLVPVTAFKRYFYRRVAITEKVYKKDGEGDLIIGGDGKPVEEAGKKTKKRVRVRVFTDGRISLNLPPKDKEVEGVDFEVVATVVNKEPNEHEWSILLANEDIVFETLWWVDDTHQERETQEREVFNKTPRVFKHLLRNWMRKFQRENPNWVIPDKLLPYGGLEKAPRAVRRAARGGIRELYDRLTVYDINTKERVVTIGALNDFEFLHFVSLVADRAFFDGQRRYDWKLKLRAHIVQNLSRKLGRDPENGEVMDELEKHLDWWGPDRGPDFIDERVEDPRRFDMVYDQFSPNADVTCSVTNWDRAWARFRALDSIRWIVRPPRAVGYKKMDVSDSLIDYPTYEEIRDLIGFNGHFRMSRNGVWKYGGGEYDTRDVAAALREDWGGRQSRQTWGDFWVWWELNKRYPHPGEVPENATSEQKRAWRSSMNRRRTMMRSTANYASETPMDTISTYYSLFGGRREDVCKGAAMIRGAIVSAREGAIITSKDLHEKTRLVRNYSRGELQILEQEELFFIAPRDIGKNQKGLHSDTIMNELYVRVASVIQNEDGTPKFTIVKEVVPENILDREAGEDEDSSAYLARKSGREVTFFHQTEVLERIFNNQPKGPILRRLRRVFRRAVKNREIFVWPKIMRLIEDLSPEVIWAMADELDELHAHCDDILSLYMVFKSRVKRGVRGFTFPDAAHVAIECQYGVRYNRAGDPEVEHKMQQSMERPYDFAWRCGKIDLQVFWARSWTRTPHYLRDIENLIKSAQSEIKGGMPLFLVLDALTEISVEWSKGKVLGLRERFGEAKMTEIDWSLVFDQEETVTEKVLEERFDTLVREDFGKWTIPRLEKEEFYKFIADKAA
ncbi:MAG: hypothetical protein WD231_05555 [Candidatus Woykebacteria bacterium]